MSFQQKISNEEVAALDLCGFSGEVLVVDDQQSMARAEELLSGEMILGFDTETRPSFSKGVSYGLSLLQLSTASCALLFRVGKYPLSEKVLKVLSSRKVLKIGAAIRDDINAIRKVQRFTPAGFVDLQSVVGQWGIEELSVKKMTAIVLGFRLSKAQRLSNWDASKLSSAQCDYAAMDAWVCREIYLQLSATAKV